MYRSLIAVVCAFSFLALTLGTSSWFLAPQNAARLSAMISSSTQDLPQQDAAKRIGFRRASWNTLHIHDSQLAAESFGTLQQLGCQVTKNQHNGHIDIRFRCPDWKSIAVETGQLLSQWQSWLTGKGMEIVVLNPPANFKMHTVRYRLATVQSARLRDASRLQELTSVYEMLGCQVASQGRDGDFEITVRCPRWTTIGLISDQQAHVWQDWLNQNGFETQHSH